MANAGNHNLYLHDNDILQDITDCERRVNALCDCMAKNPLLGIQRM